MSLLAGATPAQAPSLRAVAIGSAAPAPVDSLAPTEIALRGPQHRWPHTSFLDGNAASRPVGAAPRAPLEISLRAPAATPAVPEPASHLLLALGLGVLAARRRHFAVE